MRGRDQNAHPVILVLLAGTLAIIYGTSYAQVSADNQRMIEQYARPYHVDDTENLSPKKERELMEEAIKPQGMNREPCIRMKSLSSMRKRFCRGMP